jgi:hypothetical protein
VENEPHPFAVVRASQLQRWAASDEYRAILTGDYKRRDAEDEDNPLNEDIQGAAKSYKDTWNNSTDPLVKVVSDVGGAISGVADKVFGGFRRSGQQEPAGNGETN